MILIILNMNQIIVIIFTFKEIFQDLQSDNKVDYQFVNVQDYIIPNTKDYLGMTNSEKKKLIY